MIVGRKYIGCSVTTKMENVLYCTKATFMNNVLETHECTARNSSAHMNTFT